MLLADQDAKRLLEDLFKDYDKIVRPVTDPNDHVKLYVGIKLSQIADIDERNQIMTTNVWIRHVSSTFNFTKASLIKRIVIPIFSLRNGTTTSSHGTQKTMVQLNDKI